MPDDEAPFIRWILHREPANPRRCRWHLQRSPENAKATKCRALFDLNPDPAQAPRDSKPTGPEPTCKSCAIQAEREAKYQRERLPEFVQKPQKR